MNESKVEFIFGHDCNVSTAYTTHADYRALEERLAEASAREDFLADVVVHKTEELASIKARVGDDKQDP